MCGFAGYLTGPHPTFHAEDTLRSMGNAIAARGPDDWGTWIDTSGTLGLVHQRLAVIDLTLSGHQPMKSVSGRYVIAFNGEIYNHLDLRRLLDAEGRAPNWRGSSDTETLLAAIEAWGVPAVLQRTVGMFAFALWNVADHTLILARDRAGEKPLYYGRQGETFIFGSDLNALSRHPHFRGELDIEAVGHFLRLSYVPAPFSIYKDIKKLIPGYVLTLAPDGSERSEPYWSPLGHIRSARKQLPEDEALAELDTLLQNSVRGQMVADVPLGAFLSGGIDSSLIVALMQANTSRPVRTFTIGFGQQDYNEAANAKAVARHLGTAHTELYVGPSDALAVVPRLPEIYSEPFADVSQIPTYLVSALARRDVTVAISGDGGDELFGGYNRYAMTERYWGAISKLPLAIRSALGETTRSIPVGFWDHLGRVLGANRSHRRFGEKMHKGAAMLTSRSLDELYQRLISGHLDPLAFLAERSVRPPGVKQPAGMDRLGNVEGMMIRDFLGYLPDDILAKVDRAAMSLSLETRVPFLDHRVIEFAHQLPPSMKLRDGETKWVLRQLLEKHVPRRLFERPKTGFSVPIGEWLRGPLRQWAEDLLDENRLRAEGIFCTKSVRTLWADHKSGKRHEAKMLWNILMFQTWMGATRGQQATFRPE